MNKAYDSNDREVKELRKHLRQSKIAIPGALMSGLFFACILAVFDIFLPVPWWFYGFVLWIVPFGLIGDGINIWRIKRRLSKLEQEDSKSGENG